MAPSISVEIIYHRTTLIITSGPALLFMLLSRTMTSYSLSPCIEYLKFVVTDKAVYNIESELFANGRWFLDESLEESARTRSRIYICRLINKKNPSVHTYNRADFSAARFFIYLALSNIPATIQFRMRSACSCIVCDHINLHTNSRSFLHLVHPSPLSRLFFAFFLCFLYVFFPLLFMSTLFRQLGTWFLLYFPFSPRRGLVSFVCTSRFRTPANSHEPPVVPIKSVCIVFKLVRAIASCTFTSARLRRVVLSTAHLIALSLVKRSISR